MKRILVPIDFSEEANNALLTAHSLATDTNSDILLLHVVEDPHYNAFETVGESHYDPMENLYILKLIEKTKEKLQAIVDDPKFKDINISYKVDMGNTYKSIIEHITMHKSSLILMGTKGSSGLQEILVGSVTDKVVRHASCPVITVKQFRDLSSVKNIVFATDLNDDQVQVIDELKLMQKHYGAKIHIVKVYDSTWLREDEVEERIKKFALHVKLENFTVNVVRYVDEAEAIMGFAADIDADMIAMGTHDRHGLLHWLAGHVSKDVINHAPRPIWTKAIK
ncbi:universal stress protein [Reichenbachiella sp. MALMAid0571]|uniref:universal stress protein n=1 Tax=Reichenbachiella sp. MALMAid0571 TaxID=3143939 RepID=UPI0032DF1246